MNDPILTQDLDAWHHRGIVVVCAWCNLVLRGSDNATDVSHGICSACERKHFKGVR